MTGRNRTPTTYIVYADKARTGCVRNDSGTYTVWAEAHGNTVSFIGTADQVSKLLTGMLSAMVTVAVNRLAELDNDR